MQIENCWIFSKFKKSFMLIGFVFSVYFNIIYMSDIQFLI